MVIPAISLHVFFSGIYLKKNFFFFSSPEYFLSTSVWVCGCENRGYKSRGCENRGYKGTIAFFENCSFPICSTYVTIRTIPENWSPGDNQTNYGRKKISVPTLGCSVKIWAVAIFFLCVSVLCLCLIFFNSDLNEVQFRV